MEQVYKDGALPSHARTVEKAPLGLSTICLATFCREVLIKCVGQRDFSQQAEEFDKLCAAEMKLACHKGSEAFRRRGVALDAVVAAIAALEVTSGDIRMMSCRGCSECACLSTLRLSLPQVMHRHCKRMQNANKTGLKSAG